MKKALALGLLAVSAATVLASCSSTTSENLNSRVPKGVQVKSDGGDRIIGVQNGELVHEAAKQDSDIQ